MPSAAWFYLFFGHNIPNSPWRKLTIFIQYFSWFATKRPGLLLATVPPATGQTTETRTEMSSSFHVSYHVATTKDTSIYNQPPHQQIIPYMLMEADNCNRHAIENMKYYCFPYSYVIVIWHYNFYLIIDWSPELWRMGPLRSGPRCGTDGLGQYKTHGRYGPRYSAVHPRAVWTRAERAFSASNF